MLLKLFGRCAVIGFCLAGALGYAGEGADIYQQGCAACHTSGAAGAPKLGDKAAWEPRLALGNDVMISSALKGKNAMPAKGMCPGCSEEQIKQAVNYMLDSVK